MAHRAEAHEGSRRLAALDVGTNSIRLIVAEASPDGSYRVIDDEKVIVRLGQGLAATGRLAQERMDAAIEAISSLRGIAEGYGVERMPAVATAAVREAENGGDFVRLARESAGIEIEVISSEEEARLSHRSVDNAFNIDHLNAVIVDIGGGSTEIVLSVGGVIEHVQSLKLGAVRMTEMFGQCEGSDEEYRRLLAHVRDTIKGSLSKPHVTPHLMFGTGGTFTTLASMSMHRNAPQGGSGDLLPFTVRGYEMQRSEVKHLLDWLRKMSVRQRSSVPGLSPDRAPIIVGGLTIVERVMKRFSVNRVQVHEGGIRDGLLLREIDEMFGRGGRRRRGTPDRMREVRRFAAKCNYEKPDSEHVAHLALRIFDQLRERLGPEYGWLFAEGNRELVEAAAVLRDVGYLVNYARHHKHSYHLIVHSDIGGFSPRELEIVANVARYHRRALPKRSHPNFENLSVEDRRIVRGLAGILRIADGLDRTHTQSVSDVGVEVEDAQVVFRVECESSPAVNIWGAERKAKLFRQVFEREPSFRWASEPAEHAGDGTDHGIEADSTSNGLPAGRAEAAHEAPGASAPRHH